MMDPGNVRVMRDGARHASMLFIPGEASDLYQVQDVPHGTLSKVWYESPTLDMTRRMYVYTPTCYTGVEVMRMPGPPWAGPARSWTT